MTYLKGCLNNIPIHKACELDFYQFIIVVLGKSVLWIASTLITALSSLLDLVRGITGQKIFGSGSVSFFSVNFGLFARPNLFFGRTLPISLVLNFGVSL